MPLGVPLQGLSSALSCLSFFLEGGAVTFSVRCLPLWLLPSELTKRGIHPCAFPLLKICPTLRRLNSPVCTLMRSIN